MAPLGSSRPSLTYTDQTLEALLPAITPCLKFEALDGVSRIPIYHAMLGATHGWALCGILLNFWFPRMNGRRSRDLAAAFSPCRTLVGVAHHGADRPLRPEQRAREGTADLAGYTHYCIHNGVLEFMMSVGVHG
jgi:hypothetical protein